ncbi:MAG: DUF1127 domain-containing protein [Paracoccaceae bacterium]
MTTASTNTSISGHLGHAVLRFFAAIWRGLIVIAEANPRLKKLEYLTSLSDDELAAKGMKRENMVQYVFNDRIYL